MKTDDEIGMMLFFNTQQPVRVDLDTTLWEMLQILVDRKIHHLWVQNRDRRPIGVISLTDIILIMISL